VLSGKKEGRGKLDYFLDGIKNAFILIVTLDPETYSAIFISLRASTLSLLASLAVGLPLGFILGFYNFKCKKIIQNFVNSLLSLPTVVVGLFVYMLLSSRGPLGDFDLLFTIKGIVIGQFFLAVPIIIALTASAVESMDMRLAEELSSMGAGRLQMLLTYMYEAKPAVFAAAVTTFGRVFAEVGVSMMLGGNIKWATRTMTTAIALETGKGEFAMGIALGIVLMSIAIAINFLSMYLTERM